MHPSSFNRNLSQAYLSVVPVIAGIIGFGIGHSSYTIYLPLWILNILLMVTAAKVLGFGSTKNKDKQNRQLAYGAFFLIVPWILVSMFAGLGPPPETPVSWMETATEQQVRYFMLVIAGVFIASGFTVVSHQLNKSGEDFYSRLGIAAILLAIPLFIINMLYWGFFLTESFRIVVASGMEKFPEWFTPVRKWFGVISAVEVALTYLATVFFALSLFKAGWFKATASRIYIAISILAFLLITLSVFFEEIFKIPGFIVSIPATPFLMPYYMGINLLRRSGN